MRREKEDNARQIEYLKGKIDETKKKYKRCQSGTKTMSDYVYMRPKTVTTPFSGYKSKRFIRKLTIVLTLYSYTD